MQENLPEHAPTPAPAPAPAAASSPGDEQEPPFRWRQSVVEIARVVAIVLCVVLALREYVVEAYVIHGHSMEPTFHESERLLISKLSPVFGELRRGDIVIFEPPKEPGKRVIKRIIGLPGETVRIEDGRIFIDGAPLEENDILPDGYWCAPERVEPGHYFVLGDNREISNDSRSMGPIPRAAIVGKALILFYPKLRLF